LISRKARRGPIDILLIVTQTQELVRAAQLAGLRNFARVMGMHEESAVAIFDRELRVLKSQARITSYVGVLAEKRTKDVIRHSASGVRPTRGARPGTPQ